MKNKLILLLLVSLVCAKASAGTHTLWYEQPASKWTQALPVGNGRLGAMIYGGTDTARYQLNEETLWAGEPGNNNVPEFSEKLPGIRKALFNGNYEQAQQIANDLLPRQAKANNNYGMPYQTLGELTLSFDATGPVSNYRRELDIQSAVATTRYTRGGVTYTRRIFTDFNNDIMVIQLSADKPSALSFTARLSSPHENAIVDTDGERLMISGQSSDVDNKKGKVKFTTLLQALSENGETTVENNSITVTNASEVTLLVSSGTSFIDFADNSGDAYQVAVHPLSKAKELPVDAMQTAHTKSYRQYFDTVQFELDGSNADPRPTDIRLREFDGSDLDFISLYFQFGRYLLISSSQPGGQPANLQGIWNDQLFPPWDSKYTLNINAEMNYWPSNVTNLQAMAEPLFKMIEELAITGQSTAQTMYNADGWVVHHNTDIWRISAPVDGAFYGLWPMGGAWLTQHLWQHFLYTGDKQFLTKYWPVLENLVTFYLDVLQPIPSSDYVALAPSMSPENRHPGGASIAVGSTMDIQLLFDVFSNYITASKILEQPSSPLLERANEVLNTLPPMQTGQWGQLQEWYKDWDQQDDKHRHVSHLYGLYPSNQISPQYSPALASAARTSLLARGDLSTGWSMGWKVNLWARLLDGNRAFKLIQDQLSPAQGRMEGESGGTYDNLFDAHPPFQIDGNFGCTAGIAEMLLQSHDGEVFLLPSLPDAWQAGKVSGLLSRGGFEIKEMAWKNGNLDYITVESTLGGNLRLRSRSPLRRSNDEHLTKATGENDNLLMQPAHIKPALHHTSIASTEFSALSEHYVYDIPTHVGELIELKAATVK